MIQITEAKHENIEALSNLFADGFVHDPLYCHYIPYENDRPAILRQIFRKYLTDFWDDLTVLVAEDGAGALCICPGDAEGTERMVLPFSLEKVYNQINETAASEFYTNFLILDLLAVQPDMQGRGIGKALVGAFLKQASAAGVPGVVEIYNPENIVFYQNLGFKLAHIQPMGETLTAYLLEG